MLRVNLKNTGCVPPMIVNSSDPAMNRRIEKAKPASDQLIGVALVIVAALAILFLSVTRHSTYSPDGFTYARLMLTDAGLSTSSAVEAAEAYYLQTPVGRNPRYRGMFQVPPAAAIEASKVIANRVLYPLSASWLYPKFGFRSLVIVSAMAFVAGGIVLFAFLSLFSRPYIAAVATVLVLLSPPVRSAASSDLTDMSAFFWWVLALFGMARYLSAKDRLSLAVVAIASIALSLTRPVPYLPFFAALFCLVPRAQRKSGLALGAATAFGLLSYAVLAHFVHSGSVSGQLEWIKSHQHYERHFESLSKWYAYAVFQTVYIGVQHSILTVLPVIATLLAVIGMYLERQRAQIPLLLGAMFGCALAVLFNPVPYALPRVFELPLSPVIVAGALLAVPHLTLLLRGAASRSDSSAAIRS